MRRKKKLPEIQDTISVIVKRNRKLVKDISFDIFCPKTYKHHVRFTAWMPVFYFKLIKPGSLMRRLKEVLTGLKVRNVSNYVCGLNSKLSQYRDVHLLMLDLDTIDASAEKELAKIGGILLRSGRGYHFIGFEALKGRKKWENRLKTLMRKPRLKRHIDKMHIYISLNRGYSTLRFTKSPVKPMKVIFLRTLEEKGRTKRK